MNAQGEVVLACADLPPALAFFTGELGFRLETIFPADAPTTAILSREGLRIRLAPVDAPPATLRLPADQAGETVAPNGTRIVFAAPPGPSDSRPPTTPLQVFKAQGAVSTGRAGMIYRDLIPGRLGGTVIASLIAVPEGGPVNDWVHHHELGWQMIFCRAGWVRVAYEDQGSPITMRPGELVLQPPGIRHRVLESSPGLEVIELASPAEHPTHADHDMTLPNGPPRPDRRFGDQTFFFGPLGERNSAAAQTLRRASGGRMTAWIEADASDSADPFGFGYVLAGDASLDGESRLETDDVFVSSDSIRIENPTEDFRLLRVASFRT
jgi:quercetin dioxygenase-like cupin family protein